MVSNHALGAAKRVLGALVSSMQRLPFGPGRIPTVSKVREEGGQGRGIWRFVPWGGQLLVLALLTGAALSLTYVLFPFPHWLVSLHRRICYVPILLGGLWFGFWGGLLVALLISAAVLPIALHHGAPFWDNQDKLEIVFYISLGAITGWLVERSARERARFEELQNHVAESRHMADLGRMAAGIAHEIRTPLGSIQGAAEIMAEDYPPGHPRRPFWDILMQESARLGHSVQDFLDLGRPLTLEPRLADAQHAIDECFRAMRSLAEQRGVTLASTVPQDLQFFADPQRLYQALTNLVRNAIQVSPQGGRVTVAASGHEGAGVLVAVEDEGPGLPEGEAERLFEPFYSRRKDGTGLGLALVRTIAQAHGGWVRAESLSSQGSRFTLYLPGRAGVAEG